MTAKLPLLGGEIAATFHPKPTTIATCLAYWLLKHRRQSITPDFPLNPRQAQPRQSALPAFQVDALARHCRCMHPGGQMPGQVCDFTNLYLPHRGPIPFWILERGTEGYGTSARKRRSVLGYFREFEGDTPNTLGSIDGTL
jgi:hypothetical protein